MENNYILAVYDFRSKQDYIYKTNKVKEIMGASQLIAEAYGKAIENYNKNEKIIKTDTCGDFSLCEFEESKFSACILYEGGGNLLMLFKSCCEFIAFNNHFSWYLIENAPGVSPICGSAKYNKSLTVDEGEQKGKPSYDKNVGRVFTDLGEYKRFASPVAYADVLPFTQIDRNTSKPVTCKEPAIELSVSAESHAKREKYSEIKDDYAKNLDDLVEKKGEESLLALIYVDGNAMGQKVKDATRDYSFETGVNKMRDFSREINTAFVDKPLDAIKNSLGNLEGKDILAMRRIIGGGDEITIVCKARNALKVADIYFKTLAKNPRKFSSCMGIAIFHSHAPFADIYEIAEQCCESGKNKIKELEKEGDKNAVNYSYIDAYFCRGAITGEMKDLRGKQEGKTRTNMPYRIGGDFEQFKKLGSELNKIKRTNVKALHDAAFVSEADFELELMRVNSNLEKEKRIMINEESKLKRDDIPVFCDAAAFFDLNWFPVDDTKEKEVKEDESNV